MDQDLYYLALHLAKGISCRKKRFLIKEYPIEELFKGKLSDLLDSSYISDSLLFTNPIKLLDKAKYQLDLSLKLSVNLTHLGKDNYPKNLTFIDDCPIALYYKGFLEADHINSVSVVGSRSASDMALNLTYNVSKILTDCGFTIVSGLARGVDSKAHIASLDNNGFTIAVLGCGIDKVFPRENKALQEIISQKGCLISEYPLGLSPRAFHFPQRNRIISGLSIGVLVVECGKNSGALYTARFAFNYGRDVYVFESNSPGEKSLGNDILVNQGAYLVKTTKDLLTKLSEISDFNYEKYLILDNTSGDNILDIKADGELSNFISNNLDESEARVYSVLSNNYVKTINQIVCDTGMTASNVMQCLTSLIFKGFCNQFGNSYSRK